MPHDSDNDVVDDGNALPDDRAVFDSLDVFLRSLVDLSVMQRSGPCTIPGVAVAPGLVAAYAVLCQVPTLLDLLDVAVFRDGQRSQGQLGSFRAAWQTCAVDVGPALQLPPARVRWSTSLKVGELLLVVSCDPAASVDRWGSDEGWRVTLGGVLELYAATHELDPWEQSLYALVEVESSVPHGSLVCDLDGRLAGCIQVVPNLVDYARVLIPAEWLSGYGSSHMVSTMMKFGKVSADGYETAVSVFEERRMTSEDPRLFCAGAAAYAALGRNDEARVALDRALELQPDNAWAARTRAAIRRALES